MPSLKIYRDIMLVKQPTPNADLNQVLAELVREIQSILGANFLAAYLQGSFAMGDWDDYSDVDFLVAIENDLSEQELAALQALHPRIYALDSHWAKHLEGSYFPRQLLAQEDKTGQLLWYLDNGSQELVRSIHDNTLVVRWTTREYGICLAGLEAKTLIEAIPVEDLKREIVQTMQEWGADIVSQRWKMANTWAQSFAVVSYCRMLQSLETGRIHSKLNGVQWGLEKLEERWHDLIQTAQTERQYYAERFHQAPEPQDVERTIDFIHYAIEKSTHTL